MIARLAVRTGIGPADLLAADPLVVAEMIEVVQRQDREERAEERRRRWRGGR